MWEPTETNTMNETAQQAHELWLSLLNAGFTKSEAWHFMLSTACCKDCK